MIRAENRNENKCTWLWCATAAIALALVGCTDTTTPPATTPDAPEGAADFDAQLDPAGASFILKRLESQVPGRAPVRVDLIGNNLKVDPNSQTVSLEVAIRNGGEQALHVPAIIWLHQFVPGAVAPTNADVERGDERDPTGFQAPVAWGFDYSESLGNDALLEPGETSTPKVWKFSDPGMASFAFGAQARFGMQPDRPQISGVVFVDANRNGRRERDERPFGGMVTLATPDGERLVAHADAEGHYRFPIEVAGLYRLTYVSILRDGDPRPQPDPEPMPPDPLPDPGPTPDPQPEPRRALVCLTTPNPLEVLILAGSEGDPMSFERADFGVAFGPCVEPRIPPLVLTERRPDEIEQDLYDLLEARLEGDILVLRVGMSGCSPDHPFVLYAGSAFMESNPVQTWALLAHDDRGEACDAYFERRLAFNLAPLRAAHIRAYGRPGVVILRFRDFHGKETRFEFGP